MRFAFLVCLLLLSASVLASDVDALYWRLDSLIEVHPQLVAAKQKRIEVIRESLTGNLSLEQEYAVNARLIEEYAEFQNDSAVHFARRNTEIAISLNDRSRYFDSRLALMHLLTKSYLLDETSSMASTLDTTLMTESQRVLYYKILSDIYLFKVEFHKGSAYEREYQSLLTAYRQRIAQLSPSGSLVHTMYQAGYLNDKGRTSEAIALLEPLLADYRSGERTYSILTSSLAFYYGTQGNKEKQKSLLALSASSDIEGCIMENSALRQLASLLMDDGDIDRAYRYINQSVADATFYGTRLRNVQASQLVPRIISAYEAKQEKNYRNLRNMAVALGVVALLLIAGLLAFYVLLKRYRRISESRQAINARLNDAVAELEQSNERLRERDKIKEQYLGRFLALSSALIDRTEHRRKAMNRLAMDRKQVELASQLKSQAFYHENTALFYRNFDSAFLSIYPDFLRGVNELLDEDSQLSPKESEQLSTELRILALLRLGITDNQEIASILRSSITTIYTYRSKLKSRAKCRETFENDVKRIQSHA